jgi:general secretion pathway protein F
MSRFQYEAYNEHGVRLRGEVEGASLETVRASLQDRGLLIAKLAPERGALLRLPRLGKKGLGSKELAFLVGEIAVLLGNGVKIDRAIQIMGRSASGPAAPKLLGMGEKLQAGEPLSQLLGGLSSEITPAHLSLIELAEATGTLDVIFARLAADFKATAERRAKVAQALTYPMVILFVCLASLLLVFYFIIPQIRTVFPAEAALPLYTQFLLSSSDFLVSNQQLTLFSVLAALGGLALLGARPGGVTGLFRRFQEVPGVRGLVRLGDKASLLSALAIAVGAGIRLDRALELSVFSVQGRLRRKDLQTATALVKNGVKPSEVLSQVDVFSPLDLSILAVGEETGNMGQVLEELAERAKRELEAALLRLTTIMEPALILFMGVVVGSVVIAMLLSITSINDTAF